MRALYSVLAVGFAVLSLPCAGADAAEPIGKATLVKPSVRADGASGSRSLAKDSPIYFMDRLTSSSSGVGEFVMDDGTKLAISASARLTIDASVAPGSSRFKKLGIKAVSGSFRWISGRSPSSAYRIETPTASMAIRGTAFDVTVRGGKTHVILLNGSARLCSGGGCQRLGSSCDYTVTGGGSPSKTQPIEDAFKKRDDAARLFPFLANSRSLSSRMRVSGSNCLDRISTKRKLGLDEGSKKGPERAPSRTSSPQQKSQPSGQGLGGAGGDGPPPKP
jgi:hypothetical protein